MNVNSIYVIITYRMIIIEPLKDTTEIRLGQRVDGLVSAMVQKEN